MKYALSQPMPLTPQEVARVVRLALAEDLADRGDVTTEVTPGSGQTQCRARIISREPAVLAGLVVAVEVWRQVDPKVRLTPRLQDGDKLLEAGANIIDIEGTAASILTGERTALNALQQLSGVATNTRRYVDAVAGFKAKIVDTRKTALGLRALQKYAVRCGGGANHRAGLYDQFLFKDNHLALCGKTNAMVAAIEQAREKYPQLVVEVEADRIDQVRDLIPLKPDIILLDNMNLEQTRACVELISGHNILIEASGNMTLERVRAVAETGVDYISVGALTHSVQAIDLSLEIWAA